MIKKHHSQTKTSCYLTSTAHLQQRAMRGLKEEVPKALGSSGERGVASSNSVSPFYQFAPLPPSSSCSQNKSSCLASQGEHSISFETRARGQMLAHPICVSSGQTPPLSLPSPVIGQCEWSRQAVTAAPTPLAPLHSFPGSAGILNKAATDCKDIRARGSLGISRGSDTDMVTTDPLAPD